MNEAKKKITDWLCGPRLHAEGVELYRIYGSNLRLKRQFAVDDTSVTREMMVDELRRIAGISEAELARLPRLATRPAVSIPDPEPIPAVSAGSDTPGDNRNIEAPETARKMMRFRDRFPFLSSPDCPDVLKVLVSDMFTAYGRYRSAFARLQTLGDEASEQAAAECGRVVEAYLSNREIWDELEHYKETGEILGRASKFEELRQAEDISALSDVDLIGRLRSAQTNESKQKKALATALQTGADTERPEAALARWSARKKMLQDEVNRRKKK